MKEYKLSAKSKYSVYYLLCGLFMFFFMFSILHVSSYADNGSRVFIIRDSVNTGSSTNISIGNPLFTVSASSQSGNYVSFSSSLYVTTSEGTYLVDCGSSTLNTSSSPITNFGFGLRANYSLDLPGSFINCYLEYSVHDNFSGSINDITSSYDTLYISSSYIYISSFNNFVTVSPSSSSSSGSFDGYSSFSPLRLGFDLSYNGVTYSAGSPTVFNISNWNSTTPIFNNRSFLFEKPVNFDYRISYIYTSLSDNSFLSSSSYFRLLNGYDQQRIDISEFTAIHYYWNGVYTYVYDYFGKGDMSGYFNGLVFNGSISNGATITGGTMAIYEFKMTLNDYMNKVNAQWDSINPSVTDLNQNTAQSVSDIGTAQTFESSAFDNFNNNFSSSGLDTFSMSFASTPLLWVSSIITTFYNNMPSTFQYLLMFVAFVGILCTVLNVFGRVAQRFGGGDNATKLNSKDVFSKIEKNGSI